MRIRDELRADLDPLAAEPLLLAEDGDPSRADAYLEYVRILVDRLERRNLAAAIRGYDSIMEIIPR